jgi:hypothetical protein
MLGVATVSEAVSTYAKAVKRETFIIRANSGKSHPLAFYLARMSTPACKLSRPNHGIYLEFSFAPALPTPALQLHRQPATVSRLSAAETGGSQLVRAALLTFSVLAHIPPARAAAMHAELVEL